ncbi:MAG TPA: Fic family protein [Aldersonia sp.]
MWTWAGRFRRRELNIGVAPEQVAVQLRGCLDTIRYRWRHTDDWTPRELGVVVPAETVRVHPFVDGNGRTTRLLADLVFAAAQEVDVPDLYDWDLDKPRYIRIAARVRPSPRPAGTRRLHRRQTAGRVTLELMELSAQDHGTPKARLSGSFGRLGVKWSQVESPTTTTALLIACSAAMSFAHESSHARWESGRGDGWLAGWRRRWPAGASGGWTQPRAMRRTEANRRSRVVAGSVDPARRRSAAHVAATRDNRGGPVVGSEILWTRCGPHVLRVCALPAGRRVG